MGNKYYNEVRKNYKEKILVVVVLFETIIICLNVTIPLLGLFLNILNKIIYFII